jgi:HK97 gp10 family phage protein
MSEFVGIEVDVKTLSKAFYTARKSIREGVERALTKSAPKVLRDAKRRAPVLRTRLKTALKFSVDYSNGQTTLSIVSNDAKVDKYMMVREDGPEGGEIRGQPLLAFVPRFSPFWSKTATVRSAKEEAIRKGYTYFFNPPGSNIILGVRRKRKGAKRRWVKVGAEFAPIAVVTDVVHQTGKPYIRPAFEENMSDIQERIIEELQRIFKE